MLSRDYPSSIADLYTYCNNIVLVTNSTQLQDASDILDHYNSIAAYKYV